MWFGFWRLVYGVGQTLSYSGGGGAHAAITVTAPVLFTHDRGDDDERGFIGEFRRFESGTGERGVAGVGGVARARSRRRASSRRHTEAGVAAVARAHVGDERRAWWREGAGKGNGMVDDEWTGDDLRLEDARASVATCCETKPPGPPVPRPPPSRPLSRRKKRAAAAALVAAGSGETAPEKLDEIEREIDDIVDVIQTTSGATPTLPPMPSPPSLVTRDAPRRAMTVAFGLAHVHALRRSGDELLRQTHLRDDRTQPHARERDDRAARARRASRIVASAVRGGRLRTVDGCSSPASRAFSAATSLLAYLFRRRHLDRGVLDTKCRFSLKRERRPSRRHLHPSPNAVFTSQFLGPRVLRWPTNCTPARARATIAALNSMFSHPPTVTVVSSPVDDETRRRGRSGARLDFARNVAASSVWFVYLYVPETKDERVGGIRFRSSMTRATSLRDAVNDAARDRGRRRLPRAPPLRHDV